MKAYLLQTLKELALLGAIKNRIEISSLELSKQLKTSEEISTLFFIAPSNASSFKVCRRYVFIDLTLLIL